MKISVMKKDYASTFIQIKREMCWLAAYSCDLFTYQYVGCNAS